MAIPVYKSTADPRSDVDEIGAGQCDASAFAMTEDVLQAAENWGSSVVRLAIANPFVIGCNGLRKCGG